MPPPVSFSVVAVVAVAVAATVISAIVICPEAALWWHWHGVAFNDDFVPAKCLAAASVSCSSMSPAGLCLGNCH